MKLLFSFIITGFLLLTNFHSNAGVADLCTVNDGVIVLPDDAWLAATGYTDNQCQFEPDSYSTVLYEFGVCTAYPSPPTTTSAYDSSSVCSPVFKNSTGLLTSITKDITTSLSGVITRPPNGNYPYGYVKVGTSFLIKSNFELSTLTPGYDIDSQKGEDNSKDGKYCATQTATYYNEKSLHDDGVNSSICDDTPPTAGVLTQVLRDFNGSDNGVGTVYPEIGDGLSITGTDNEWVRTAAGYLQAYLTKSNGLIPTSHSEVEYILGIQKFSTPVVVTENSSSMDVGINVSQGIDIDLDSDDDLATRMGPFSIILTVQ